MSVIIHGPQGCGKSTHSRALAAKFGLKAIVDEWQGGALAADALALTNFLPMAIPDGANVIGFDDAMRQAGLISPC